MVLNFVCRESKKGKNGLSPLECSIIINGNRKIITLGRRAKASSFNTKSQKVRGDKETNDYIEAVRGKFFSLETEMIQRNLLVTTETIIDAFKNGLKSSSKGLLSLFKEFIDEYAKEVNSSLVQWQKLKKTREYLEAYVKEKTNKSEIMLENVSPNFIEGFYKSLLATNSNNTAINKMKQLKRVIQYAIDEGYIKTNPFKMKMHKDKLTYNPLTVEEIQKIREKDFGITRLNNVRDIIVFACYSGLAYADLKELSKDDVRGDMIIKNRHKTSVQSTIPLLPIAKEILEKHNYKLPMLSNQKMNAYVKEVGDLCGITKELHMHLFRHTFATLLLNSGVDIVTVSKCCGHSNSRITESVYAQMQTNTIKESVLAIADKIQ